MSLPDLIEVAATARWHLLFTQIAQFAKPQKAHEEN